GVGNGRGSGEAMELRKTPYAVHAVVHASDRAQLRKGKVLHVYSAAHYKAGTVPVAALMERPEQQHYARLGYKVVATYTEVDLRGDSICLYRERTPAQELRYQARALLARGEEVPAVAAVYRKTAERLAQQATKLETRMKKGQ